MNISLPLRTRRVVAAALLVAATAGCNIAKPAAPSLTGPSEFGLSVTLRATPEILLRDGASISTIRVSAYDERGRPKNGQRFVLASSAGTLSTLSVTTGADGQTEFEVRAPGINENFTSMTVQAVPVDSGNSGNVGNAVSRTVSIGLIGPTIVVLTPLAAFTYAPALPAVFEVVGFDATTSTVNGTICGSNCTYAWNFGDGTTRTGITETHRYQAQGVFTVTLTVTTSSGTTSRAVQTVTVGAPAALTPVITVSPTNPRFNETVFLDGRGSTVPNGATIVRYEWDFGNGGSDLGSTATTSYDLPAAPVSARTFTVRLIITDSLGRTGTATATVTVSP